VKRSGTKIDSTSLLDCPHCGATPEALDKRNGKGVYAYSNAPSSDIKPLMHVACLECGSGSPSVKVWNSRKANNQADQK
jgi:ribosomal protein L32